MNNYAVSGNDFLKGLKNKRDELKRQELVNSGVEQDKESSAYSVDITKVDATSPEFDINEFQRQYELQEARNAKKEKHTKWQMENIPERYRSAALENINQNLVKKIKSCENAIVQGENGSGKTYLAYALANDMSKNEEEPNIIVTTAVRMLYDIRSSSWNTSKYDNAELLVIDEFDKLNGSDNDFVIMSDVIDFRYKWKRKTIVLMNFGKRNIDEVVGQSNLSRLVGKADGGCYVKLSGQDRRMEIA